jgi:hypothetical protein
VIDQSLGLRVRAATAQWIRTETEAGYASRNTSASASSQSDNWLFSGQPLLRQMENARCKISARDARWASVKPSKPLLHGCGKRISETGGMPAESGGGEKIMRHPRTLRCDTQSRHH